MRLVAHSYFYKNDDPKAHFPSRALGMGKSCI